MIISTAGKHQNMETGQSGAAMHFQGPAARAQPFIIQAQVFLPVWSQNFKKASEKHKNKPISEMLLNFEIIKSSL